MNGQVAVWEKALLSAYHCTDSPKVVTGTRRPHQNSAYLGAYLGIWLHVCIMRDCILSILNNINVLNRSNAQQKLHLSEPTQA